MQQMNVWIVNPFDNLPAEGYRPQRYWLMSKAFAAAGHDVVFWTSDFSHASKRKREFVRECALPGVETRLVPTLPYPRNICLKRITSHSRLAKDWARMAGACGTKPDVVVASLPPLGLCRAAMRFAKSCGALFVADIMDAWPETFGRIVPGFMLAPLKAVARSIYCGADAVSAVAARYGELAKSYGATCPVKCCYHGIEVENGEEGSGKREAGVTSSCSFAEKRETGSGAVKLVYIGAMGESYDLETAIAAVKEMPGFTLDLAGSGPKEAALRAQASDRDRIRFHGYLRDDNLKALLRSCDIALVPMFPDSCVGVPYKLADYAAARLRVAECLGGETQSLVERFGAGGHYEPRNVASLKSRLAGLAVGPAEGWDAQGFVDEFDASRIMSDYVSWVAALAEGKRS